MTVRSAKCHFVNEQQLIQLQKSDTVLIIVKKHDNIYSDSKFEMSTNCFLHAWSLSQNDSIAVLI